MVRWAAATRLRLALAITAGLMSLGGVFAMWSYLGHLADDVINPAELKRALAMLDEGKYEDAKSIIAVMQRQRGEPEVLGGAMFVLGARFGLMKLKASHWSSAAAACNKWRRDTCKKLGAWACRTIARGRPRICWAAVYSRGGQFQESIGVLEEMLHSNGLPFSQIHLLLLQAMLETPEPDLVAALEHAEHGARRSAVAGGRGGKSAHASSRGVLRLDRIKNAQTVLGQVAADGPLAGETLLMSGRLTVALVERLAAEAPPKGRSCSLRR